MYSLIYFFRKYKYFLFFVLLEIIGLALIINNHSFHKSKFVSSSNFFVGGVYSTTGSINDYFNLRKENDRLVEENHKLLQELSLKKTPITKDSIVVDTSAYHQKFAFKTGRIINNKFNSDYNFLTINLGKKDSVFKEMAVFNSKGIIGITDASSNNYARVVSILNKDSKINARPLRSSYFGTLIWNGKDYNTVQLSDIPRQAVITKGDTIVTGGKSAIFPEGIGIGTVKEVRSTGSASKIIDITLFNDMSNLRNVYVVYNFDKLEIQTLESTENE